MENIYLNQYLCLVCGVNEELRMMNEELWLLFFNFVS